MISKLRGILDSVNVDSLILDVQGVGYYVYASRRTLSALPDCGLPATLWIEYLIRQEQPQLYGFSTQSERICFQTLITVQGVGAKVALAILSALTSDELTHAIATQNKTMIARADGVGPKLAGRIVSELKDKVSSLGYVIPSSEIKFSSQQVSDTRLSEAISALINLGYRRSEAVNAVVKVSEHLGPDASIEDLVRVGLANLSSLTLGSFND